MTFDVERNFNASRLRLARKRRGLTKVTLGTLADVSTRALSDFESGRAEPADETAQQLADKLRFPIEFFFRPDIEEPRADAVSFRSLKSMTAGERDTALAAGAMAFELSQLLDVHFELPAPDLPDLRDFEPEDAALTLRNHWGIGERPVGNMIHLLESRGVRVFSLEHHSRRVDAYSLWYRGLPFVFLNTLKTAEHNRMDAAHELGHLVLHQHGARRGRDVEKDAQAFGSAFLMPRGSVLSLVPRLTAPSLQQLVQLKTNWKVSVAALAHRLYGLRLLSEWSYRGICIQLSRYGRSNEPHGIERETSQLFGKVFAELRESGVTKSDVARRLGLYTQDLDALIFRLSVTSAAENDRPKTTSKSTATRAFRVVKP